MSLLNCICSWISSIRGDEIFVLTPQCLLLSFINTSRLFNTISFANWSLVPNKDQIQWFPDSIRICIRLWLQGSLANRVSVYQGGVTGGHRYGSCTVGFLICRICVVHYPAPSHLSEWQESRSPSRTFLSLITLRDVKTSWLSPAFFLSRPPPAPHRALL